LKLELGERWLRQSVSRLMDPMPISVLTEADIDSAAWLWCKNVSTELQLAVSRTAGVIARIMASMPDAVRNSVVDIARSSRKNSNRTISRL
jgi:hypothetical protein